VQPQSRFRNGPLGRPLAARVPDRLIVPLLDRQAARAPTISGPDDGSRIDILVGFSKEAEAWVGGLDKMIMEIAALVAKANEAYEESGVTPRLNLVGMWRVNHPVMDPDDLKDDAFMLRDGGGDLGQLHTLRDQLGADLVSLLVFNGGDTLEDDACGKSVSRGCGYGFTQRDFPGSGDVPGTPAWENKFAHDGFSVSHIKSAVRAYTFHHEVSHNLGAHHDFYTFFKKGTTPTADRFARGWIAYGQKIRTVMAYNALCEFAGTSCTIFNRFSNPNDYAGAGEWWGSPVPGGIDGLFGPEGLLGPVDNARAINRMAWTVAHYRLSNTP
jgi:hypothetical protein